MLSPKYKHHILNELLCDITMVENAELSTMYVNALFKQDTYILLRDDVIRLPSTSNFIYCNWTHKWYLEYIDDNNQSILDSVDYVFQIDKSKFYYVEYIFEYDNKYFVNIANGKV